MKHVIGFGRFVAATLAGAFTIVATLLSTAVFYVWLAILIVGDSITQLDGDVYGVLVNAFVNMLLLLLDPVLYLMYSEEKDDMVAKIRKELGV